MRPSRWLLLLPFVLLASSACSVNPATGKSQLSLIGENQEIQMGAQEAQKVAASMPLYPDEELQRYVDEVGQRIAASSERPDLPWSFQVVDDPVVNAFALPGGYIFLTRGILSHFNSEAEMASVIGHEIGHVTARHSVNQISKAQLANLGLAAAMIASPEARAFGDLAGQGLGLLFLRFGRDDERQADDLGLRYMVRNGYDPSEMPRVFEMLDRKSAAEGLQIPVWTSTHPDPGDRSLRIAQAIRALPPEQQVGEIGRESYLERIEGMPYGDNPREGFAVENVFYHPELEFRLSFPQDWPINNQPRAVVAMSPGRDALVVLTLAEESSRQEAARSFFEPSGIDQGSSWRPGFYHFRTAASSGATQTLRGVVGFVEHGGQVYRLVGYTTPERWSRYQTPLQQSLVSFDSLRDSRYLNVQARTLEIVELPRSMTAAEFLRRYPSTADDTSVLLLNNVLPDEELPAGAHMKRVVGGQVPGR